MLLKTKLIYDDLCHRSLSDGAYSNLGMAANFSFVVKAVKSSTSQSYY